VGDGRGFVIEQRVKAPPLPLVSSVIWLVSAALGTWVTPKASILAVVIGGFFSFLLTQMMLRLSGRRASLSRENAFHRETASAYLKTPSKHETCKLRKQLDSHRPLQNASSSIEILATTVRISNRKSWGIGDC
jgi:hypothetical protein